jgi:hypothetical protein
MVNLFDRGVLQEGKNADIVRVQLMDELPMVRAIWKNGRLVLNSCSLFILKTVSVIDTISRINAGNLPKNG